MNSEINFCNRCGGPAIWLVPPGDVVPRHVCECCGTVQYQNPKVVVGALPIWQDKILLCRRAIEPRQGFWTLPAGFMENNETLAQAAVRETLEEACADIEIIEIFTLLSVPHVSQIHAFFRTRMRAAECRPGAESLEVRLFAEEEIPWHSIAFRTTAVTLRHFFNDRSVGEFRFHAEDLFRDLREAAE